MSNQPTPQTNGNSAPAPVATTPAPIHTFTEAPASLNLKFNYRGYEGIMLTLRGDSGLDLLSKLDSALNKLEGMGAQPTAARPATDASGAPVPLCQYHGPMKASDKKPGSFYCPSKMGDGSYCRETA